MKIKVENLGTIKKGEIDLDKNLTVFVGGNNSGKSYMSYLVYGIFKMWNIKDSNDLFKYYQEKVYSFFEKEQILDEYLTDTGIKINLEHIDKKLETTNLYKKIWEVTINHFLPNIFGSQKIKPNVTINHKVSLKKDFKLVSDTKEKYHIRNIGYDIIRNDDAFVFFSKEHISDNNVLIKTIICRLFSLRIMHNFYFFPAERSGINLFSKEIFKEKALERDAIARQIQNEDDIEALVKSLKSNGNLVPRYPLAISDYLYFVDDLKHITSQPITEFDDLAMEIEHILEGKVSISTFGDIQFQPKGSQENLALHLSASIIKSLSGLVFYLRHLAKEKDIIIIDEPELNLHPENQILFIRVLAKMANRGIKIIFSTHSDYVISELSNLLILSQDFEGNEMLKQKYGYDNTEILTEDKVNVFAFQNHTIEAIPITEQGIEVDKIEKIITDLNQRSNDIYYSYLESLETQVDESQ